MHVYTHCPFSAWLGDPVMVAFVPSETPDACSFRAGAVSQCPLTGVSAQFRGLRMPSVPEDSDCPEGDC